MSIRRIARDTMALVIRFTGIALGLGLILSAIGVVVLSLNYGALAILAALVVAAGLVWLGNAFASVDPNRSGSK